MPISDMQLKAEEWIRHVAWIGKHDDPCAVASEAAGIMRVLLDELAVWIEQAEKSRKIAVHEERDGAQRVDVAEAERDALREFVKEVAGLSLLIADNDREFKLIQRARTLVGQPEL
jgi:hypothetical protein